MSLRAGDVILYPRDSTKKLLKPINEFSKIAGYKISIKNSDAFLYTNNKLSEKEIQKTIIIPYTKRLQGQSLIRAHS